MQLAPKKWCFDCGKYVGRKWQEICRCGSCMDKLNIELGLKDKPKPPGSDDIPYQVRRERKIPNEEFRENLPDDSDVKGLFEWFESGDANKIVGHVGDRGDSGSWNTFEFEILDNDGDMHTVTIDQDDLPEEFDWDDLFDWLDDLADEYDVDYDNDYGESE